MTQQVLRLDESMLADGRCAVTPVHIAIRSRDCGNSRLFSPPAAPAEMRVVN